MKKTLAIVLPFLAFAAIGCGDDTQSNPMPDGPPPDSSQNPDGLPAAPTLGAQIDRMGRPGINTALSDPLWNNSTPNIATTLAAHEHVQDLYNQEANPANWAAIMLTSTDTTVRAFARYLAIYDGLDRMCGNQLGYMTTATDFHAYVPLATVIADDQLYVDTTHGTCTLFLGVEANGLGMANTDCGGRAPSYNVIDVIYNVIAGTAQGTVSNGITANSGSAATDMAFPWLGAPN